ncbi:MAG: PLP-dependent aminotransferase family protein [Candidatus Competibacteraceae bacterium]|nr:PLP-dependent aminotransferase family protein [Candidatus Competibacteraceae bacterium]
MLLTLDKQGPLYLQIYRALRKVILHGELSAGSRLPASRAIATELGVSRNVVLLAYDQLRAEGYVSAHIGSGTFVAQQLPELAPLPAATIAPERSIQHQVSAYAQRALQARSPALSSAGPPPRYDFSFAEVAVDTHSLEIWKRLQNRHARSVLGGRSDAAGYGPLRDAIADYVFRKRGIACSAEQVLMVNGTQQALDLIARVLLDPGASVVLEEPHYAGARAVFLAAGANIIAAPVDHEGLNIASVGQRRARLVYITPSHQFPTGVVMPLARRLALLEWAQKRNAYVIEDDYDSEYRYEGRPLEAVQALDGAERTLYIGTFSKHLFPALRLGFLILPQPLVQAFLVTKQLADRYSAMLNQVVLADFIAQGHFERHLRRMRTANQARRKTLLEQLEQHLGGQIEITGTNAGVHLAIWLPGVKPSQVDGIIQQARAAEVGVYSINPLFYKTPHRAGLLLGYETLSEAEISIGIQRLAQVLRPYLERAPTTTAIATTEDSITEPFT